MTLAQDKVLAPAMAMTIWSCREGFNYGRLVFPLRLFFHIQPSESLKHNVAGAFRTEQSLTHYSKGSSNFYDGIVMFSDIFVLLS